MEIARLEPSLNVERADQELAEVLAAVAEGLALVEEQARGQQVVEKVGRGLGFELLLFAWRALPIRRCDA